MSSGLMDTEAGGEGSQYESIQTVTQPHSTQGGQMGQEETQQDAVTSQQEQQKGERGERTAENTEAGGSANQDAFGATDAPGGSDDAEESRRNQGYGSGSGVGG